MSTTSKDHPTSIRVTLIERKRDDEREQELLEMFNEAAADVTEEDLVERESLLGPRQ
jgi:hypothetical protein